MRFTLFRTAVCVGVALRVLAPGAACSRPHADLQGPPGAGARSATHAGSAGAARAGGLPCDTIASSACFGVQLLETTYDGPALQLTRASDSATLNVPFLSNGQLDVAQGDAFCSGTTCAVTTWYDQNGVTACNAVNTAGNAPVWDPLSTILGFRPVVFPGVAHTTSVIKLNTNWLTLGPGCGATTFGNAAWVVAGQTAVSFEDRTFLSSQAGLGYGTFNGDMATANAKAVCAPIPLENEPAVFSYSWANRTLTCSSDARQSSRTLAANKTAVGGWILGSIVPALPANMDALGAILLTPAPSSSTLSGLQQTLAGSFGIALQHGYVLWVLGDSTSMGEGSSFDTTYPGLALPSITEPVSLFNGAVFGYTLKAMAAALAPGGKAAFRYPYSPSAQRVVAYVLAGANDIRQGTPVAQIEAYLSSVVASLHALGPNVVVLIATEPLQCNISTNAAWLAALEEFNTDIENGWSSTFQADGLVDIFANSPIGPGSYTYSAFCNNPAISPDGEHLTRAAELQVAPVLADAVNAVLP